MKAVIILVDGMRPDGLMEIPYAKAMSEKASFTMNARTVYPSVTLPCHMSLFHSVDPSRHGVTTNTYTPQVRPVKGLCEVLNDNGKTCAFFYNWEELRDLSRPGSLIKSYYVSESDRCGDHQPYRRRSRLYFSVSWLARPRRPLARLDGRGIFPLRSSLLGRDRTLYE